MSEDGLKLLQTDPFTNDRWPYHCIASPADILRRASRVPSPRGEVTRDARLRMSAGEAIPLHIYPLF